jgi:hypothetical protein
MFWLRVISGGKGTVETVETVGEGARIKGNKIIALFGSVK